MFQEGHDRDVEHASVDRSADAWRVFRFDPGAARQLAELLRAVAVYAAGGMTALRCSPRCGRSQAA